MGMVREIAPGILLEENKLYLCPACGMDVFGGDPMDEGDVFCWVTAVLYALGNLGAKGCDPAQASKIAHKWIHEGGHKSHAKGGHNVLRN